MTTLKNISDHGIIYIAMTIADLVKGEGRDEKKAQGMWIGHTWLTPEQCYWCKKLLEEVTYPGTEEEAKKKLQAGTNLGAI